MNAPHQFPDPSPSREGMAPTLEQRLRFVDLCFEAAAIAGKTFPPIREEGHGMPRIANPHFGPAYNFQRAKMMRDEGLPLSLLGDGKSANQRHFEKMHREFGVPLPWAKEKDAA